MNKVWVVWRHHEFVKNPILSAVAATEKVADKFINEKLNILKLNTEDRPWIYSQIRYTKEQVDFYAQ